MDSDRVIMKKNQLLYDYPEWDVEPIAFSIENFVQDLTHLLCKT